MVIEREDDRPPINFGGAQILHMQVDEYHIGEFHPEPDGKGRPTAVLLEVPAPEGLRTRTTFYLRFKSYEAVLELCQAMMINARECWPEQSKPYEKV